MENSVSEIGILIVTDHNNALNTWHRGDLFVILH